MCFRYFIIIPHWKMTWPFIWTNLNSLYQRLLSAKVDIGPYVLEKESFKFLQFILIFPNLYNCRNWLSVSGEKDLFYFVNVYFTISQYLPRQRAWPFIWRNLNPFHPRMLCAKIRGNWPIKHENVKSLQTDDRQSEKLTRVFSSGELIQTDTSNQLQRNYKGCKTK